MTVTITPYVAKQEREVGQIETVLKVSNAFGAQKLRHGEIARAALRTITVADAMVDTGATMLCLPQAMIDTLGLEAVRDVRLNTATGFAASRVYDGFEVECEGRRATVEVIALPPPGGHRVLLGAIPMEIMGLEPDLKNRRLRVLPDQGDDTYLTA